MNRLAMIGMLAGLLASPAAALTPAALTCSDGDVSMSDLWPRNEGDETYVDFYSVIDGVAFSGVVHCGSERGLWYPNDMNRAADDYLNDAWNSEKSYSFRQIVRGLKLRGVKAEIKKMSGTCACDPSRQGY